ncbi:MAG: hypothetical protein IJF84_13585 [Thermoguttaceae bacterium]|nr:hypothetical protein [Thermoguttaceae bacterium]
MEEQDNTKLNEWVVTISRPFETSIHVEAANYDDAEKLGAIIARRLPLCVFEDTGATIIESVRLVHHDNDELIKQIFGKLSPPDVIFNLKADIDNLVNTVILKAKQRRQHDDEE